MPLDTRWRLRLWAVPALLDPQGGAPRCEGKALALLTYLALEGPTPRARLADLLWPDTGPASRNNLVVLLRRMERTFGEPLWAGRGPVLSLAPHVQVRRVPDVTASALAGGGVLLAGLDTSDLPEFRAWLDARRPSLGAEAGMALREAARDRTERGDHAGALPLLARAEQIQPLAEDTARARMRAEYLTGNLAAALGTYGRLRDGLARELEVAPTAWTQSLAREIARGAGLAGRAPARVGDGPGRAEPQVEAPRLVGRDAEWRTMQAAWAAGQVVVLTGESGLGKSRLAWAFAAAWAENRCPGAGADGEVRPAARLSVRGRPSDGPVPYAALTRGLRSLLARHPELPLSGAARRALGALLPEWFEPAPAPGADVGAALEAALREVYGALGGAAHALIDDLHLMDPASGRTLLGLAGVDGVRMIVCTRADVLGPPVSAALDGLVQAGRAAHVALGPLDAAHSLEVLASLNRPELRAEAAQIARLSGGRPLYLLEAARHVLAGAGGPSPDVARWSGRAEDLILRRVEALTPEATQVARAAAVLAQDLRPEVLADMLGLPLLTVTDLWQALTRADIVTGERFTHDLVREALLGRVPSALLGLLHRAAARALTREGGPPARLAAHWKAGGRLSEAARALMDAATGASQRGLYREAVEHGREAAHLAGLAGNAPLQFAATDALVDVLYVLEEQVGEWQRGVESLLERASTPREHARAQLQRARLHFALREEDDMARAARAGLALATQEDDAALEAELLEVLSGYELHRDLHAARVTLTRLAGVAQGLRRPELQAWALEGLGFALLTTDPREAGALLREAEALHLRTRPAPYAASAAMKAGRAAFKLGEFPAALAHARRARQHLGDTEGFRVVHLIGAYGEALTSWALDDRSGAAHLVHAETAAAHPADATPAEVEWRSAMMVVGLWLDMAAGDVEGAQQREHGVRTRPLPPTLRAEHLCARAALQVAAGAREAAVVTLDQALVVARSQDDVYLILRAQVQRAALLRDGPTLEAAAIHAHGRGLRGLTAALSGQGGADPALALALHLTRSGGPG